MTDVLIWLAAYVAAEAKAMLAQIREAILVIEIAEGVQTLALIVCALCLIRLALRKQ